MCGYLLVVMWLSLLETGFPSYGSGCLYCKGLVVIGYLLKCCVGIFVMAICKHDQVKGYVTSLSLLVLSGYAKYEFKI